MNRIYALLTLTLFLGLTKSSTAQASDPSVASLTHHNVASLTRHTTDTEADLPITGDPVALKAQPWEKTQDLVTGHIAHDKLSGMKTRTQTLITLLQDSCFSAGAYTSMWHGEYFSGRSLSGSLLKFAAQCSFYGQEKTAGKKADLLVLANDLTPLLGHFTVNDNDYLTIKANITGRNGCRYFELSRPSDSSCQRLPASTGLSTRFWLITADSNRLPYIAVTRKEYLLEAQKQLAKDSSRIAAEWWNKLTIRSAAGQEAQKKQDLEQLKTLYSGMELEARTKVYLTNFITDEDYLEERIKNATAAQHSVLLLMDSLLRHAADAQLNRPAIVTGQADAFQGFEDGQPGATMLVKLNPAYFDPYLSEEKPQFFLVGWRFDPADPLAGDLDRQLRENFDGQKLKEMLRK